MFLRIDGQKQFHANSEENLGFHGIRYFLLFCYFELFDLNFVFIRMNAQFRAKLVSY